MHAAPAAAMSGRFLQCLEHTARVEGGYSDHPRDRGGRTMKGVTYKTYNAYRDAKGLPRRHVRELEEHERLEIYWMNYWLPIHGEELPAGVDLVVFDSAVTSGPARATRQLQAVLGAKRDGHMGLVTISLARKRNDPVGLIDAFMAERRAYLQGLADFAHFGRGWMNRCDYIGRAAIAMTGQEVFTQAAGAGESADSWVNGTQVRPLDDPDEQSASQGRAYADDPVPPMKTELALGGTGLAGMLQEAFSRMAMMGRFSVSGFVMAMLSSPTFWVCAVAMLGSVYAFMWRRAHK